MQATPKKRIIVATHQLPFTPSALSLVPTLGHSAQHAGARSLVSATTEVVHVGWVPETLSDTQFEALRLQMGERMCVPVRVEREVAVGHYEGYCKSRTSGVSRWLIVFMPEAYTSNAEELWPLFHYILWDDATDGLVETQNWKHYIDVNERFANEICKIYREGDLIWIQDYHLMLVPALLRKLLPNATIGFFLHTPFPSSEVFRCLPSNICPHTDRVRVLSGVLGANMIGFQTYSHARHFISSCTRVLGLESSPGAVDFHGFNVSIEIFPIGIDLQRVEEFRLSKNVANKIATIRELFNGKRIIIGRDKLDNTKGVLHKFAAFERFLEMHPEWRQNVVLIQVTSSGNLNPATSSKLADTVARINGNFGSLEFLPVHHYHENLDPEEYYALLSIADIALITSIRDGMNTTSHEYIACQQENKGVLILSEFTGSAGSLSGATLVNPWDYAGVANAINEALLLPKEERIIRHEKNTAAYWSESFITELYVKSTAPEQSHATPELHVENLLDAYSLANKRLLMFDYDGTLTPIVKIPSAAVPPSKILEALVTLVADPRNVVFIISGRDQAFLDHWLGHIDGLGLSAEHGSFIKYPGKKWINLAHEIDFSWKKKVEEIFNYYEERTQGSFTEHKICSITWHYRLADPEYGSFQAKECHNHLEDSVMSKLPVEILVGKKNLEV